MKGLPARKGLMGFSLCHVPLLSASEWEPNKGVDPPTKRDQARLPFGSFVRADDQCIS